jgi:poly-beta-1,6-N-acetyl-D-glucosamine N-deacetylase
MERLDRPVRQFLVRFLALATVAGGLTGGGATGAVGADADERSAVVFMYHRFGEEAHPTTSVDLAQLDAHIAEINDGKYHVAPVPEIVTALKQRKTIPDRTIGLTIDDAFLSVYQHAWPRLRAAGLPFTLFVATDAIDQGRADYMSWDQIRELAAGGAAIGSQTASHLHMPMASQEQIVSDLSRSMRRLKEELGFVPTLFAYPYGEFSNSVKEEIEAAGFEAAFGQHSGVAFGGMEMLALPRFSLNKRFGGIDRFRLAGNALPLPVTDFTPADSLVTDNPPPLGFSIPEGVSGSAALACFYSHESAPVELMRLGPQRVEVRAQKPLPVGRTRVNCTAPAGKKRWRWFGTQFIVPTSQARD